MSQSDNARIAKNTLFLYLRMIVTIAVNLYTVRLLWKVLGVDNYGIYNVVGGIVLLLMFINSAMVGSTQRFMSYAMGKKDAGLLSKTFSIAMKVHVILAAVIVLLAETAGLWFLNTQMNIPAGRMVAANWVFQCSMFAFILNVVSVPYNAAIVAHERMHIYGYFGIVEVLLKLVIVYVVILVSWDKLITYSVLVAVVALVMRVAYGVYCKREFEECTYRGHKDKGLLKEMLGFAKWSFIGVMGISFRDQGMNLILNLIFNVAVNAAKGVAHQIISTINGFSANFTMALTPQIIKRYSVGDIDSMMNLMRKGCKFSLILMSFIVIPLTIVADPILKLWLGDVAPYTAGFLQLGLVIALIESIVTPITTSIQATGDIRKFQILISIIMLLNLPVAWVLLKLIDDPYIVMYVMMVSSVVAICVRLYLLHGLIPFSYRKYAMTVFSRSVPAILLSFGLCWIVKGVFSDDIWGIVLFGVSALVIIAGISFTVGLDRGERRVVIEKGGEILRKKLLRKG